MSDLVAYNPRLAPYAGPAREAPRIRGYAFTGLLVIALFVGGFGTWAAIAPLASAAVATGVVKVETNRKVLQHLEGGVISEILVRDGDAVQAGQALVRMDDVDSRADRDSLLEQLDSLRALEARLIAQRDGRADIDFPAELIASQDSAVTEVLEGQRRIFSDQQDLVRSQKLVLLQRIAQFETQLPLALSQVAASREIGEALVQQLETQRTLLAKELATKSSVLELERQLAAANDKLAAAESASEGTRSQLAEAKLQIEAIDSQFAEKVSTELRDVQIRRSAIEQQINKADARFGRHDVLSPQDGIVMNLRYFAAGSVVPPGGAILDLVPDNEALTIEARIQPIDIDSVREDLPAKIRLVAYKQRTTPVLDGRVARVSPDAKIDERSGQAYFIVNVEIDPGQLSQLTHVRLYPGMPVEVAVVTGERTMLDYLVQPMVDSFSRAFTEE